MKNLLYTALLATFFMMSCKTTKLLGSYDDFELININVDGDYYMLASNTVDSLAYMPIKTPPNIKIGNIKEVWSVKDNLYIYDDIKNQVVVLNSDGSYVSHIYRRGRSSTEYMRIADLAIDTMSGDVIINPADPRCALLRYTSDGQFAGDIPMQYITQDFVLYDKGIFAYGGSMPQQSTTSNITSTNQPSLINISDNRSTTEYLPTQYIPERLKYTSKRSNFSQSEDKTLFIENFSNITYEIISSDSIVPRYVVQFGRHTLPLNMQQTKATSFSNTYDRWRSNPALYCDVKNIDQGDNYIFITYEHNKLIKKAVYDKQNKQVWNIGSVWRNDYDYMPMPQIVPYHYKSNVLIGYIDALQFKGYVEKNEKLSEELKLIGKNITTASNPILVKVYMKNNFDHLLSE